MIFVQHGNPCLQNKSPRQFEWFCNLMRLGRVGHFTLRKVLKGSRRNWSRSLFFLPPVPAHRADALLDKDYANLLSYRSVRVWVWCPIRNCHSRCWSFIRGNPEVRFERVAFAISYATIPALFASSTRICKGWELTCFFLAYRAFDDFFLFSKPLMMPCTNIGSIFHVRYCVCILHKPFCRVLNILVVL